MGDQTTKEAFEWSELLGPHLVSGSGQLASQQQLHGKVVALYFSAHWCPPCRSFTPRLVELYAALKKKDQEFEVVFVSSDSSLAQFEEYFKEMPWLAVPFSNAGKRQNLMSKFTVTGIPTLTILSPEGKMLSHNARAAAAADPLGAQFPWVGQNEPRPAPISWIIMAMIVFFVLFFFLNYGSTAPRVRRL